MSDLAQICWTAALTLVGGAGLFLLSEVITRGIFEPRARSRELLFDAFRSAHSRLEAIRWEHPTASEQDRKSFAAELFDLSARFRAVRASVPRSRVLDPLREMLNEADTEEVAQALIQAARLVGGVTNERERVESGLLAILRLLQPHAGKKPKESA